MLECRRVRVRGGSRKKSDRVPTINNYSLHRYMYIYGNFLRDLNIREFLILVLFVKFNIKTRTLPYLGLTDIVTELWNVTF